jgi:hypothetical protein
MSRVDFPAEPAAPVAEKENLPFGKIVLIGVTTLAFFALGCIWVRVYQQHRRADLGGMPPVPEVLGKAQIGIVNQRVFPLERSAQEKREIEEHQLSSYGWVDRKEGVIHVPIERAMDLVSQGAKP